MMELYLVRHGQTELNKKKVYYGKLDVPINHNGRKQCQQLSKKLSKISFDLVITSTLSRTIESARIVIDRGNQQNNIRFISYSELAEIDFGAWEGMHYTEIELRYPYEWLAWVSDWENYQIPDGESFQMFYERVEVCLNNILKQTDAKKVLIVAHEGTLKVIATILLKIQRQAYWSFCFEFGKYSLFQVDDGVAIIKKINC